MKRLATAALLLALLSSDASADHASSAASQEGDKFLAELSEGIRGECIRHRPWGDGGPLVLEFVKRGKGGLESRTVRVIDPLGNVINEDKFFLNSAAADNVIAAQPGLTDESRVAIMPIANALQVFFRAPDGRLLFTVIPLAHLREAEPNPAIWPSAR